ncbi:hypothetical protein [Enterobacter asburiae]|uniref:hypothetical protein n=1 Tax=Enterobacter asburiae TaxID=61645 RepID=UPI003530907F
MTANKPMTGEQLDELMTVAVNMQRDAETDCNRPSAMFAYAVQVAILELRKVRNDAAALAAENALLKKSEPAPFSKLMMEALDVYQAGADEVPELAMLSAYKRLRDGLKTPATDAFLAEVRAQGVEMFAASLGSPYVERGEECYQDGYTHAIERIKCHKAPEFAAQLRKGVQS